MGLQMVMEINCQEIAVFVSANSPYRFCCCVRFSRKVNHDVLYAKSIAYPVNFLNIDATPESDNMNSTAGKI